MCMCVQTMSVGCASGRKHGQKCAVHVRSHHDRHIEKPVKSLSRWYNSMTKDRLQSVENEFNYTIHTNYTIDKTFLPGTLKLWCLQFGL